MKTTIWTTEEISRGAGELTHHATKEEALTHAVMVWRHLTENERRNTEIIVSRYDDGNDFPDEPDESIILREITLDFQAGDSRHGSYGVSYLIERDSTREIPLYAECRVPEDGEISEDYGYYALVDEIRRQAEAAGIPADFLVFPYDRFSAAQLADDARADVEVKGW